jgi:hypothetical protein
MLNLPYKCLSWPGTASKRIKELVNHLSFIIFVIIITRALLGVIAVSTKQNKHNWII